jgi:hypothetical protein
VLGATHPVTEKIRARLGASSPELVSV